MYRYWGRANHKSPGNKSFHVDSILCLSELTGGVVSEAGSGEPVPKLNDSHGEGRFGEGTDWDFEEHERMSSPAWRCKRENGFKAQYFNENFGWTCEVSANVTPT